MILLSSAYAPNIQYFSKLLSGEDVYIEAFENFQKQTYRSRCIINSPQGPLSLTIPVCSGASSECTIRDVCVSDHGNWRHRHWNAIKSSYGSSAFFEYLEAMIEPFYTKKYKWLFDFNLDLLQLLIKLAQLDVDIRLTDHYITDEEIQDNNIRDYRNIIRPKNPPADPSFIAHPYYQTINGDAFLPNLSIMDLLFEMGYETEIVLKKCIK